MKYAEKQIRKSAFGKDYKKTFKYPSVSYDEEQYKKIFEFKKYWSIKRCINCNAKYSDVRKHEDKDNYSLVLECDRCLSNEILDDPISVAYVKWLTDHLSNYSLEFDTFPLLPNIKTDFSKGNPTLKVDGFL